MNIIKSEFITKSYQKNEKFIHWSRVYEWEYVLEFIRHNDIRSIHNTACGGLNIGDCLHLTFADELDILCKNTIHSDLWGGGYKGTDNKPSGDNFILYDITTPFNKKFDLVLNISTIEHLPHSTIESVIYNLLNQINDNGHLILTFDYPVVNKKLIENVFNTKILDTDNKISGKGLNVILIHIQK